MACHKLSGMTSWQNKVAALQERGWTLTQIAEATGASVSAISDLKHDRTHAPTGMVAVHLHHLYSTGAKPPSAENQEKS